MAHGKSVRNHTNASVIWSSVPVRVWVSYESMVRRKSVWNHPNTSVTWSSRAVHGRKFLLPRDIQRHNSKFFETSCGFAMHAVWFPMCLNRLGPYGTRRLSECLHETHGCVPTRKTLGAIGVCGPWEVRTKSSSCDAIVTCVLPILCVFVRCLAQLAVSHELVRVSYGFGMWPFGCIAGPCRRLTGFGTTNDQSCGPVCGKGLRTQVWASFGARTTLYRPKIVGSQSLKAVHAHRSATGYTATCGSKKSSKNRTNPSAVICPVWSGFRYALDWQTRTQSVFIWTGILIKLSWAHMPFRFCRIQVHISQLLRIFHNNSLLAWIETNRMKPSCFEAMSNEKWKQKWYIY